MMIAFQVMVFMILAVAVVSLDSTTPITINHIRSMKNEIKCGACPCGTTCYTSPPPPPPPTSPTPSPPPPSPPPPTPSPPPPPKKPSPTPGVNCPPPPKGGGGESGHAPPDYIYIAGPPKDLYPVVQSISAACRSFTVAPRLLVLSGLLGILALW